MENIVECTIVTYLIPIPEERVYKMESSFEKQISRALEYTCQLDIMNKLVDSDGLRFEEITKRVVTQSESITEHLEMLVRDRLVKFKDDKYYLTASGKEIYRALQQIVRQANIV